MIRRVETIRWDFPDERRSRHPELHTGFLNSYWAGAESARRIHAGLNKGEARNDLARAVFFNRLRELRDRTYENQRYRASGLNLVIAAIVLWNTVYLERAVKALRKRGEAIPDDLVPTCRRSGGNTST